MNIYTTCLQTPEHFPISFVYDGIAYRGFGDGFSVTSRTEYAEADGMRTVMTLMHPAIGLTFEINAKTYPAYHASDCVVTLRNEGSLESGIVSDLLYDVRFAGEQAVLRGINGDAGDSWYQPYRVELTEEWIKKEAVSGRPSHWVFPYFDLVHGNGGTLIALGWPGRWKAHFRTDGSETTLMAGQHTVATCLCPGESLRMPLLACVDYDGRDEDTATAAWRHWFMDCNMPRLNGEKIPSLMHTFTMADGCSTEAMKRQLESYWQNELYPDMFWVDAGWYTGLGGETVSWPQTGSLLMDTDRFPDRLSEVNALLRAHGAGLLLWFEPEVVRLDSEAFVKDNSDFKAEWLLGRVFLGSWLEGDIIDFGNPEAVDWVFGRVCKVIDDAGGLLCYRQDFNCDPAEAWAAHDGENRVGMTENKFVCGYLTYWDRLLARYPDMFIDSCASGGGRNDLETLRRSVPLHYTDYFDGINNAETDAVKLGMTSEIFKWFLYFKNCNNTADQTMYQMRLNYAPAYAVKPGDGSEAQWKLYRRAVEEYDLIRKYYYAEYYPLTPSSKRLGPWTAWEFFDSTLGEGFIQVFRPSADSPATKTLCVKGLIPDETYTLRDTDGNINLTATGSALANGFEVTLNETPGSAVILISRA